MIGWREEKLDSGDKGIIPDEIEEKLGKEIFKEMLGKVWNILEGSIWV